MPPQTNTLAEFARLTHVLLKHPREAFRSDERIAGEWKGLHFGGAPSFARAVEEYDALVEILKTAGVHIDHLPAEEQTNLDSLYVRDASIVCLRGVILCRM